MNFVLPGIPTSPDARIQRQDGMPTGCVLVFHNMLRKLLTEQQPTYFAAVYESGRTFVMTCSRTTRRIALTRPTIFVGNSRTSAAARGDAHSGGRQPGFEADDVIATLALAAVRDGIDAVIVSGDKTCVKWSPGITIFDPMKNLVYDEAKVLEVNGVRPTKSST